MDRRSDVELAKILWDYNNIDSPLEKSNAIIVLGSHDIRVAGRGAEIFLQGLAPVIVFSGGFGRLTAKEWTKPEAEMFADVARKMGVPQKKMIIENKSTNTAENVVFSMKLLQRKRVDLNRVILVHKPYMERRALAVFKKNFPMVEALMTGPQLDFENYRTADIADEDTINIVVEDTQRIKLYAEKEFAVSQEIPDEVWQAYEELVRRGFTSQLAND